MSHNVTLDYDSERSVLRVKSDDKIAVYKMNGHMDPVMSAILKTVDDIDSSTSSGSSSNPIQDGDPDVLEFEFDYLGYHKKYENRTSNADMPVIEAGQEYKVTVDGVDYMLTAYEKNGLPVLGNSKYFDLGEYGDSNVEIIDEDIPFGLCRASDKSMVFCHTEPKNYRVTVNDVEVSYYGYGFNLREDTKFFNGCGYDPGQSGYSNDTMCLGYIEDYDFVNKLADPSYKISVEYKGVEYSCTFDESGYIRTKSNEVCNNIYIFVDGEHDYELRLHLAYDFVTSGFHHETLKIKVAKAYQIDIANISEALDKFRAGLLSELGIESGGGTK